MYFLRRVLGSVVVPIAAAFAMTAGVGSAAFIDTFENDTVGSPPAGWLVGGTSGSAVTATVENDPAILGNQMLALRDTTASPDLHVRRGFGAGDTRGFVD